MDAVETLSSEHKLIAGVLDAFEGFARKAEEKHAEQADLSDFVDFFRGFVDLYHHDKEETILFPLLVRQGLAWDEAPLGELRHEHRLERYLLRTLRQAALQNQAWTAEDLRHCVSVAREFISFSRKHIQREDQAFRAMTEQVLGAEEQANLSEDFQRFEADLERTGEVTRWRRLAEQLMNKYGD